MKIWEHTFEELTGGQSPYPNAGNPFVLQVFDPHTIVPFTERPQFATAMVRAANSMADQVLLVRDGDGWRCIGHWTGDTIALDASFIGQGLAKELFLRAVEHRKVPLTTKFTQAGYDLVRRAYSVAVQRAHTEGLNIPEMVLKQFPSLKSP